MADGQNNKPYTPVIRLRNHFGPIYWMAKVAVDASLIITPFVSVFSIRRFCVPSNGVYPLAKWTQKKINWTNKVNLCRFLDGLFSDLNLPSHSISDMYDALSSIICWRCLT